MANGGHYNNPNIDVLLWRVDPPLKKKLENSRASSMKHSRPYSTYHKGPQQQYSSTKQEIYQWNTS